MPGQSRLLDGTCIERCGFTGKVFSLELSDAQKTEVVGSFRVWRRAVFDKTHSHIGLELMTESGNSYFIEKCSGRVTLSRPRRVDSSGEWVQAKVKRTLGELEMLPTTTFESYVVDLLWDALMNQ